MGEPACLFPNPALLDFTALNGPLRSALLRTGTNYVFFLYEVLTTENVKNFHFCNRPVVRFALNGPLRSVLLRIYALLTTKNVKCSFLCLSCKILSHDAVRFDAIIVGIRRRESIGWKRSALLRTGTNYVFFLYEVLTTENVKNFHFCNRPVVRFALNGPLRSVLLRIYALLTTKNVKCSFLCLSCKILSHDAVRFDAIIVGIRRRESIGWKESAAALPLPRAYV